MMRSAIQIITGRGRHSFPREKIMCRDKPGCCFPVKRRKPVAMKYLAACIFAVSALFSLSSCEKEAAVDPLAEHLDLPATPFNYSNIPLPAHFRINPAGPAPGSIAGHDNMPASSPFRRAAAVAQCAMPPRPSSRLRPGRSTMAWMQCPLPISARLRACPCRLCAAPSKRLPCAT